MSNLPKVYIATNDRERIQIARDAVRGRATVIYTVKEWAEAWAHNELIAFVERSGLGPVPPREEYWYVHIQTDGGNKEYCRLIDIGKYLPQLENV